MKPKFSIVVPCYNEEHAIADTVRDLCNSISEDINYELIVVNDGSSDKTADILTDLAESNPVVVMLSHARNRGYGAALKSGIAHAKSDLIVITDADGTYPNHRITELVDACENLHMVVGARVGKDVEYSRIRAIPKVFLKAWVSWIAGQPVPDINSGMRVMRKDVVQRFFGILPDGFSFTITITLAMLTNYYSVQFIPIGYRKRIGKSKIRPIRDTMRFGMLILRTGIYFAPLRLLSPLIGFLGLLSVVSLGYDTFVVKNLTDKTVVLFLSTINASMFALLADMIDKRSAR